MKYFSYARVLALTIMLMLTACGGHVTVKRNLGESLAGGPGKRMYVVDSIAATAKHVPPRFVETMRKKLKAELVERHLLAADDSRAANEVEITVTGYHMRSELARQFFLLSGADTVAATVTVKTEGGDKVLGEAQVGYENTLYICKDECMASQLAIKITEFLAGGES